MNKEGKLSKKRLAILLEDGFNNDEFELTRDIAKNEGARVDVVSSGNLEVKPYAESNAKRNKPVQVDSSHTDKSTYDGVVIVSGVIDHSQMAENEEIKAFINREFEAHTPIVAIGSGEKILEDAGVFESVDSPGKSESTKSFVRGQSVMFAKDMEDKKAFSDEFVDFLSKS
ncbi:DJ-1/PfpI family protein [Halocola ammonii]